MNIATKVGDFCMAGFVNVIQNVVEFVARQPALCDIGCSDEVVIFGHAVVLTIKKIFFSAAR